MNKIIFTIIGIMMLFFSNMSIGEPYKIIIENEKVENQEEKNTKESSTDYQNLMIEKINWIVKNSNLDYQGELLPSLVYLDSDIINLEGYGTYKIAQSEYHGNYLPNFIAIYNKEDKTILVDQKHSLESKDNHYILIHELVHYLQDINNVQNNIFYKSCPEKMEEDAYSLQRKWMTENQITKNLPDPLFVALLTGKCFTK
jgi:hypothetical protein